MSDCSWIAPPAIRIARGAIWVCSQSWNWVVIWVAVSDSPLLQGGVFRCSKVTLPGVVHFETLLEYSIGGRLVKVLIYFEYFS